MRKRKQISEEKECKIPVKSLHGVKVCKYSFLSLTHTGFLLDDLQYPLGGQQKVNEAAEAVSSVLPFHHAEELPQNGTSGDTEGSVQSRQGALDTTVQRLSVLT